MHTPIKWLDLARQWREKSAAETAFGRKEALIGSFAAEKKVSASSVRRCSAVLDYAEALVAAGSLGSVDDLAYARLEHLTLLQRVAKLDAHEAAELLRDVIKRPPPNISDLRAREAGIRATHAGNAASSTDANLLLHRLGAAPFKARAIKVVTGRWKALNWDTVSLSGRGPLVASAHVVARVRRGGPFHAARMIPTVGLLGDLGRQSGIVTLALALSRTFETFDLIAQSPEDGRAVAELLRSAGPSGAGVKLLADGQNTLESLYDAERAEPPDLSRSFAASLDARFPQ